MIPIYYFTGLAALTLASCAAFFSISGLGSLYSTIFYSVVVMAIGIELGKIVGTFWIHRNFRTAPKILILLLTISIIGTMAITSGGVYGFLTKGHLDQETPMTDTNLRIERIDLRIQSKEEQIDRAITTLTQMNAALQVQIDEGYATRSQKRRQEEKPIRDELNLTVDGSYDEIDRLQDKRLQLKQQVSAVEAKLGPVKYLAALFGLDTDKSVRYFTLLIVVLLDPFAILLVLATSVSYNIYLDRKRPIIKARERIIAPIQAPTEIEKKK